MKKLNIIAVLLLFMATSCAEFTDITPKGKNMLSTTDELELLLNTDMYISGGSDFYQMTGDLIYAYSPIASTINAEKKSKSSIIWTWDEDMDKFAELVTSDYTYSDLYEIIGKIANPILSLADAATGTDAARKQLKAEAYCLRAWAMYILVNKFAKAYNPSTAADDPAIPVYLENDDIATYADQWSVRQVYDQIVVDAQAAIDLNALPVTAINRSRMCSACPYAIKAMALLAMQDYTGAEEAARASLAINGTVTDFNDPKYNSTVTGMYLGGQYPCLVRPLFGLEEDIFQTVSYEYLNSISPECLERIEPGYATCAKMPVINMMVDYLIDYGYYYTGLNGWPMTYDMSNDSYWNDHGLKTTQQYMIVAQCEIEKGNFDEAMKALDAVRVCRLDPASYVPLQGTVNSRQEAIAQLKRLCAGEYYNTIYAFINRKLWNQLPDYRETFTKELLGNTYTLTPESPLWIFPFPHNALANPNVSQNYNR